MRPAGRQVDRRQGIRVSPRQRFVRCASPRGLHRMSYLEWGDPRNREVLLCVHGLTRTGRDFDFIADGKFGLLAGGGKFAQGHAAFALEADIDDGMIVFDCGYGALDHAAFKALVFATE